VATIKDYREALALEPTGPDRYRGTNLDAGHGVVFGGQLLAQSIVAALRGHDGMAVKTLHTVFARGARHDLPLEITVDPMHGGRTFASATVSIGQEGRLCTRSLVLLHAAEDDFIRHAVEAPAVGAPEDAQPVTEMPGDWEIRLVGGVDINDPDAVGPAELDVWTRFAGASDDVATNQALLAFATDGFLIATAMRPHRGVGQAQAHRTVATGVVSHTLTFHERCRAGDWLLLAHTSPYAGAGRGYGRADVFQDDRLVASFVQDSMIRAMPPR
jgi:acyl-CoA thioesterase-2